MKQNFGNHTGDKRWQLAMSAMLNASNALQQAERQMQFSLLTQEDIDQVYQEINRLLGASSTPPGSPNRTPTRKRKSPDDSGSDASGPAQSSAKKSKSN